MGVVFSSFGLIAGREYVQLKVVIGLMNSSLPLLFHLICFRENGQCCCSSNMQRENQKYSATKIRASQNFKIFRILYMALPIRLGVATVTKGASFKLQLFDLLVISIQLLKRTALCRNLRWVQKQLGVMFGQNIFNCDGGRIWPSLHCKELPIWKTFQKLLSRIVKTQLKA